jgi:acetoin utilization deacetylase AcuC-like enzyme
MEDLVFYYPQGHESHYETGHPERPGRVEAIRSALEEHGFWGRYPHLQPINLPASFLESIHTTAYLKKLEEICQLGMHFDADTYTRPASWQLAINAAGGAAAVARAVWSGESKRGFALTRPPGHHATPNRAMGFCLLNNIALAAEYLLQEGGASRLAIVDLDLHHGNGTQDIFFSRGDVFYLSTHQYPFYPGSGWLDEIGSGSGDMKTANFPLPPFSGDTAFRRIMAELILPILDRFSPQMILVSYGFDPHWRDPLGNLQLTSGGYGYLIESLTGWADDNCQGRISLFLEGGYDLEAARDCSLAVVAAMLDEDFTSRSDEGVTPSLFRESNTYESTINQAKQLWGFE